MEKNNLSLSTKKAISDADLEEMPYLVIEEMVPGAIIPCMFKGGDKVPIANSRLMFIKKVHAIRFSLTGCYLGRNFGKNPHYTVNKTMFDRDIRMRCLENDIPLKIYPCHKKVTCSDIIIVFNYGSCTNDNSKAGVLENEDEIQNLIDELAFDKLALCDQVHNGQRGMTDYTTDAIRGAVQTHFGFGSNYSLTRMETRDGGYVCPRILNDTVPLAWKNRFSVMTKLGDIMYGHEAAGDIRVNPRCGLFGNSARNRKFSSLIQLESKIEALTFSRTNNHGCELDIHVDVNNDETVSGMKYNYNYVICAWQHLRNAEGQLHRNAILGYSRRSVGDFLRRSMVCSDFITRVIRPFIEGLPGWRIAVYPSADVFNKEYFLGEGNIDRLGALSFPPTINKQATYLSAFADEMLSFKDSYEAYNKIQMSVEKQIECILPIVFCNNAHQYVRVLQDWKTTSKYVSDCVSENISHMFIHHSNHNYGSYRNGGYPRHQPNFNTDPSQTWIFIALRTMRNVLLKSLKKQNYSYKCILYDLKRIHRVGDLTAQHLVHLMCLVNLLHPKYGLDAIICLGTKTALKLHAKYGIQPSTFPCLIEYVSVEMNYPKYVSENVICQSLQPTDNCFLDCIVPLQRCVYWISLHKGEPKLHSMSRSSSIVHKADLHRVRRTTYPLYLPFEKELVIGLAETVRCLSQAMRSWYLPYSEQDLDRYGYSANRKKETRKRLQSYCMGANRKRRKNETSSQRMVPSIRVLDWTQLDERQLQEYTQKYNKEIRQFAIASAGDSSFVCNKNHRSTDLRLIHSIGHHYTSSRLSNMRSPSFGDLCRSPTLLQSLGVEVQCLNLYRIAASCFMAEYRSTNYNTGRPAICKITTNHTTECNNKKRTLHTATASIILLDTERSVVEITYISQKLNTRSISLHSALVCDATKMSNQVPKDAQLYTTVAAAKEDLLWYLATRNGNSHRWLSEQCPEALWKRTTPNGVVDRQESTPKGADTYLLLTLQNGPSNCKKGNIFCTLRRNSASSVVACFHNGTRHQRVFNLGTAYFPEHGCKDMSKQPPQLGDMSKTPPLPGDILQTASSNVHSFDQNVNSFEQISVLPKVPVDRKIPLIVESVPRNTTISKPTEIDPFGKIQGKHIQIQDYPSHLARWLPFWTEVLPEWNTSYVVRSGLASGDKYWHPPGVSWYKRSIRSRMDLFAYLEYCFSVRSQHTLESHTDQSNLYLLWVSRKRSLSVNSKNRKIPRTSKK